MFLHHRRNREDLSTQSERAIDEAITQVESLGANENLTAAVMLLQQARDKVSDYIDEQLEIIAFFAEGETKSSDNE